MPAVATLEDLKTVQERLDSLRSTYPDAFADFSQLFRTNRKVGYKNIIRLLLGEATPEKLKAME